MAKRDSPPVQEFADQRIQAMPGLLSLYFGADEATSSLTNVSLWTSLEAAKQLDTFQPMLDLAKPFAAKGATFERPIMNYTTLRQLKGSAVSDDTAPQRPPIRRARIF